ncbi:hypothetical protein [Paenibacillus xylaniclasticus]|uniref:hypothetical protein n=1 Tax=Paenibacillus xylaniclasticus TaxID=588083 RepID=UPI000FDAA1B3|nr:MULTISPECIES: hypothetical protein [Paenibacillus]GFN30406.1 hypothetical protein PCURB6_06660 [Paenibacillus curdlanolyticus]
MITLWKLLNIEVKRLAIPFVIMVVFVTAVQLIGVHIMADHTLNEAERMMKLEHLTSIQQFEEVHQLVGFADAVHYDTRWITLSIGLCIAFMLFYFLFIWYRDFLGKHPFIYRLLMIPGARHHIYFAKLVAPLIVIFSLLAVQMVLLKLESSYYYSLLPAEMRTHTPLRYAILVNSTLYKILPLSADRFVFYYGSGIAAVIVLYTAVLLERSFRLRGLFGALLYAAVMLAAVSIPFMLDDNWFSHEIIRLLAVIVIGIGALSLWLSLYLLKRKITV